MRCADAEINEIKRRTLHNTTKLPLSKRSSDQSDNEHNLRGAVQRECAPAILEELRQLEVALPIVLPGLGLAEAPPNVNHDALDAALREALQPRPPMRAIRPPRSWAESQGDS